MVFYWMAAKRCIRDRNLCWDSLLIVTDPCIFYLCFEAAVVAVLDEVIDVDAGEEDLDLEIDVGLGRQPDLVVDEFIVDGE